MAFEHILFTQEAGVARLRLNRPAALNALSRPLLAEVIAALDAVATTPDARVLVLSGEGKGFSSGADLTSGGASTIAGDFDAGAVLEEYYNPLMERLFALPVPVIAAVHGPVVGAGCMLALAADLVVAARSAYFLQAFVNVGLVPDAGSSWWLPRLIGAGRATAMMLLGERVSAATAAQWGMIYEMVEDDALAARTDALAEKFARGPTRAYGHIRRAVRAGLEVSFSDALARERIAQRDAGSSSDFREGVLAFREKRRPAFEGR